MGLFSRPTPPPSQAPAPATAAPTVTLDEIVDAWSDARSADGVRSVAQRFGMVITVDWAGRESLSQADARRLIDGSARREHEHREAWKRHLAESEQWENDRAAAVKAAADKAAAAYLAGEQRNPRALRNLDGRRIPPSAAVAAVRRDAAHAAGVKFEKSRPPPQFQPGSGVASKMYDVKPRGRRRERTVA